jgi:hypothetical protein
VRLRETADGTELSYEAKAQIGGKLAQVGSRLIDSVAKKMADDFFKALRHQLLPPEPEAQVHATPALKAGPALPEPLSTVQGDVPVAAVQAVNVCPSSGHGPAMVPAWGLAPAAVLGAALAIAGANLIR